MSWTAFCANDDGSIYTAAFEMDKAEDNTAKPTTEQTTVTTSPNPKTGMFGGHGAIAGLTALMTLAGIAVVKTSRKKMKTDL